MPPDAQVAQPAGRNASQLKCYNRTGGSTSMAGRGKFALPDAEDRALAAVQLDRRAARMKSATRSAIMMAGKLVLALGTLGMTEASATRRPATP